MSAESIDRLEVTLGRLLQGGVLSAAACLTAGLVMWMSGLRGFATVLLTTGLMILMATPIRGSSSSIRAHARLVLRGDDPVRVRAGGHADAGLAPALSRRPARAVSIHAQRRPLGLPWSRPEGLRYTQLKTALAVVSGGLVEGLGARTGRPLQ